MEKKDQGAGQSVQIILGLLEDLNIKDLGQKFLGLIQQFILFVPISKIIDRDRWEKMSREFLNTGFEYLKVDDQVQVILLRDLVKIFSRLRNLNDAESLIVHQALLNKRNDFLSQQGGVFNHFFNKSGLEVRGVYNEASIYLERWDGFLTKHPAALKSPMMEIGSDISASKMLETAMVYYKKRKFDIKSSEADNSIFFNQGDRYYVFSATIFQGEKNNIALISEELLRQKYV